YLGVRNRDPVTGLVNYAYIIRHLEQLRIKGQRVPISVVLAEVKGLSELNMVKGYLYGNCVLRRSAVTFTGLVRTRDIVGRIGGGKFIFAFMHTGRWEAEAIAARIKLALIYAVMTIPDDCATMEELLDGVEAYLSFIGGGNPQRTKLANGGC
ncbi:MAG: diguanylate cyclase, partial [Clostridia bacterium]|nr:diguanylate cyclase [Clostridia bacterium]